MKISVDDVELFTLTDTQTTVIQNEISADDFDSDMKRRLQWVIGYKYEQCYRDLRAEWEPKLVANGVTSFPADKDAFAALVFAQPNYLDRKGRDLAAKAAQDALSQPKP
jgi:hypothetical protein